jgi:hypothetical protein
MRTLKDYHIQVSNSKYKLFICTWWL